MYCLTRFDSYLCSNGFTEGVFIGLNLADIVSLTWLIVFSNRYDYDNPDFPYDFS